ncbi:MAG: P-type conjugative transfer ATPase TrbB [Candidatus Margulisbacteria bacterium]|nr:P-type conjugative transfer ATPase TrbB [Candidatus Margulisiibacteriota bacterium]
MGDICVTSEKAKRINQKLNRELGIVISEALKDKEVIEILLNPDGTLWIEKLGKSMKQVGTVKTSSSEALMRTIATSLNTTIRRDNPILEGELLIDGSRFEGLIPPIVSKPTFTIRKRASKVFSLKEYVASGTMTNEEEQKISEAVIMRKNILVVGSTGSGKTTLTNAIIHEIVKIYPDHRIVIIEDTSEIQCAANNSVILKTSDLVDMQRLLKATMRLRPDRILVGEVRGGEALSLLKAWNTGHPGGIATVHANSAYGGLIRLEQLVAEISPSPMQHLIAEAIDYVVFIEKTKTGRRIGEIIEVSGYGNGSYIFENVSKNHKEMIHEIN